MTTSSKLVSRHQPVTAGDRTTCLRLLDDSTECGGRRYGRDTGGGGCFTRSNSRWRTHALLITARPAYTCRLKVRLRTIVGPGGGFGVQHGGCDPAASRHRELDAPALRRVAHIQRPTCREPASAGSRSGEAFRRAIRPRASAGRLAGTGGAPAERQSHHQRATSFSAAQGTWRARSGRCHPGAASGFRPLTTGWRTRLRSWSCFVLLKMKKTTGHCAGLCSGRGPRWQARVGRRHVAEGAWRHRSGG